MDIYLAELNSRDWLLYDLYWGGAKLYELMDIYLAGGLSGNLSKEFKVLSKLLAGEHPVKKW